MNMDSKCIWTMRQTGLRSYITWAFMVGVSGILFGGTVAAFEYFCAPWEMYLWNEHLSWAVLRIPEVLAVLVGAKMAAAFILAVTVAFLVYCLARRFFADRNKSEQRAACELSKLPQ
jgi:hypothetical protein